MGSISLIFLAFYRRLSADICRWLFQAYSHLLHFFLIHFILHWHWERRLNAEICKIFSQWSNFFFSALSIGMLSLSLIIPKQEWFLFFTAGLIWIIVRFSLLTVSETFSPIWFSRLEPIWHQLLGITMPFKWHKLKPTM